MPINSILLRISILTRTIFVVAILLCGVTLVHAQAKEEGYSALQVLPAITFLLAVITGILNLYIMNKLSKAKDEILVIVRGEINKEVSKIEETMKTMVTREHLDFFRKEMSLTLEKIEYKIDRSAERSDEYRGRKDLEKG